MPILRVGHLSGQSHIYSHGHKKEWELHFVASGNGQFANEKTRGNFSPGSLLCSAPREIHEFHTTGGKKNLEFYYLLFLPEKAIRKSLHSIHLAYSSLQSIDPVKTKATFDEILYSFTVKDVHLNRSAQHLFLSFIYSLASGQGRLGARRDDAPIRKAVHWLQQPKRHLRGLDALAAELSISKHHLVRTFTKAMGVPPLRYARQVQMQTACQLLKRTTLPIFRIASDLGYDDEFYFSRLFKKQIGVSPQHYRLRAER
ncbi:MAG: helix-turn-helix transcriptional regulator [Spirochaetia bacterium]|nr:helix-turn-helix transcriptional regulator [Spirochaetia bacterium]